MGLWYLRSAIHNGAVRSVLVNFSYDATKITYVNGSTSGLFNVMESITGVPTVRYLGVSTTNVPVVDETRLATVVFRVNPDASGTITFNCITSNVDRRIQGVRNSIIDDNELI